MMKNNEKTLAEGQRLHQAGQLLEAKAVYLELIEKSPNDVAVLHLLGILAAEEGDLDLAEDYIRRAITIRPKEPILRLHLANVLKGKEDYVQAMEVLTVLTQEFPQFAAGFNNLGAVYFAVGRVRDAIAAYQSAINLQADYIDAYYNLGLAYKKNREVEQALFVYGALLEFAPQHVGAQFQLASLLMEKHQYEKAAQAYEKILHDYPHHFESATNLATSYLKLGLLDQAKDHYQKALAIMPDDIQVIFNLAVINMQQGKMAEAIKHYELILTLNPNHYEAHHNLAYIYLTGGNIKAALNHYQEVLRIQPENIVVKHTVDILMKKENVSCSPPEYVRSLFDSYADHYDLHLKKALHYDVPRLLFNAISPYLLSKKQDVLDLGCGTGLCGEIFKSVSNQLVGVDISAKMLEVAAEKKIYDALCQADLESYLQAQDIQFDLVVAGDVLVYFGNLVAIMQLISQAVKKSGYFVFNAEIHPQLPYHMNVAGRFEHSKTYLDALAVSNHFDILHYEVVLLRTQNEKGVYGHLYVLKKNV